MVKTQIESQICEVRFAKGTNPPIGSTQNQAPFDDFFNTLEICTSIVRSTHHGGDPNLLPTPSIMGDSA